jgi:putative two-component system response regulator
VNILIVDDAAINHTIYQSVLKKIPGVTFRAFTNSQEALDWARENVIELAIVDYNMPHPNGLAFIEQLRGFANSRFASILMVTAAMDRDIRYRALELGANDFLVKPVDPIELEARARNMLMLADGQEKLSNRAAWLAFEVKRATENIRERERETINRLTRAAEFRDNETGMHIVRIGLFCAMIGRAAGLSPDDVEMLLTGAPMHDIGKVSTPDNILLKPGKLDAAEWTIMRAHTTNGYEILRDSSSALLRNAADIALGHHEKFDGTGYPYGRKAEEIPLFARICAFSDVFDALTSVRPYKSAWPVEEAVRYIENLSSLQFDPALLTAFKVALPEIIDAKHTYADAA